MTSPPILAIMLAKMEVSDGAGECGGGEGSIGSPAPQTPKMTGPEMVAWLQEQRKGMPTFKETGAELIRKMRDEGY
jgi:hypothetical protein